MDFLAENIPLRVLLADDHEIFRAGLKRLLSIDKNIKIVDEASNGEDAVSLVKYHKPDIALLDILMPRMNGIEAAKILKSTVPDVYVIMLTAFEDFHHIDQALSVGADGYLTKDIPAQELVDTLRIVMRGERVFSRTVIKLLQKKYVSEEQENVVITKREQEIINLVAKGKTSQEISDILNISVRTVESHRYNIMQKLDVKNAAALVRYAVFNTDMFGSEANSV